MEKISISLKHYSIIFSIVGIVFLYAISISCKPMVVDLSEISDFEGKEIISKGVVKDITETKYGNQIITIEKNHTKVKVFSEEKTNVTYGDLIKVQGTVEKYMDSFEIVVGSKELITIVRGWANKTMPVSQLSIDPSKFVGINIKVDGYIDSIYNSYFSLKDLNKSNTVIVSYEGGKSLYLNSGKKVIVKGVFTYDEKNFRYIIRLLSKDHGVSVEAE